MDNGMMTSAEAAEALGISRPWLTRLAQRGDIRPTHWAWAGGQYRCWYNALDVEILASHRRRNGGRRVRDGDVAAWGMSYTVRASW